MDAKRGRQILDEVCAELDEVRRRLGRLATPLGVGTLLALGALAGCDDSKDLYGVPPRYDGRQDGIPPTGDAYGIPRDVTPWKDVEKDVLHPIKDMYGVPKDIPAAKDAYGVPDKKPPPVGDAYGIPSKG